MGPRRSNNYNNKPENSKSKQQEREARQQEKKSRDKKTYLKVDENAAGFRNQLRTFNLQLRDIAGDGNCLFRSFADQMDGDQHRHAYYREQICDFMRSNREDFEPFIVDQPFDSFVRSLSKDGTYGGNECLVAFSRLFDARICIHQLDQPVWTVCFSETPKHEIHISYHNYEHYSSVRKLGDRTSTSANIRQAMTTCDPTTVNEKNKNKTSSGACAMEPEELFGEHDVEYILSQLTSPVDPQLIRDTLTDNRGDIDGTISYLLTLDIPVTPQPTNLEKSDESIERIMAITQMYDVDLVQQSFANNNLDIDSTVDALLKLKTNNDDNDDEYEETEETTEKTKPKNRPISSRQARNDKKKAKKERATEKHRAQILAASNKPPPKQSEEKSDSTPAANNDQEHAPPANMEFIRI